MTELRKKILENVKRVVVKVGTSILTDEHGKLSPEKIGQVVSQVCCLKDRGVDFAVVSSGAIGAGMGILGLKNRPAGISMQQATAAIGQIQLMRMYDDFFKTKKKLTAQVLLTQDDFSDRKRCLNARNTLLTILSRQIVPIINENDTTSTEEIKFGDNDKLSSLVCNIIGAELLIILSDVDGLLRENKELIAAVEKITPDVERLAKGTTKQTSLGGMTTKLQAAKAACAGGAACVIANGHARDIIVKILEGENAGTLFLPQAKRISSKKSWIAFGLKTKGKILVDDGAHKAVICDGKSLLASGITGASGDFQKGDVVGIALDRGRDFARGIANYSSQQIEKIKGLKTPQIESALGAANCRGEVVHRDNLVIL